MVAIVSGSALGLNLGSSTVLGQNGLWGSASFGRGGERAYVNAATGNLVLQGQDELLAGPGLNAASLRTYNSQGFASDDNTDNWFNGPVRKVRLASGTVNEPGSVVIRRAEDSSESVFTWSAERSCYVSPDGAGAYDTLTRSEFPSQWIFVDGSSRTTETYSTGTGRLLSVNDADGNSLTLTYSMAGLLKRVTSSTGEITYYDYTSGTRQLAQIRTAYRSSAASAVDQTLTRVRFAYDGADRLVSVTVDLSPENNDVTDGRVFTTNYSYEGSSQRIATITQSDGAQLSFTYDETGRVKTITDALNGVTTLGYDTLNRKTTVQDARGQVTSYWYDEQGRLTQVDSPAVAGVVSSTKYGYNANGDLTSLTDAENRSVYFEMDGRGNVVRQTDGSGHVVRRVFNDKDQLISETVTTDGEPAAGTAATRYVYDASGQRLRFVLSAEGRVAEYRYESNGLRSAGIQYAGALFNLGGRAFDSVPTEAELNSWASAQDRSKTQRVDMSYDWRGQLQTETRYSAVDAAGNGVRDGSQAVTQYVYDTAGQLRKTIDARNGVTQFTYDGLGRVLTRVNALNQVSTTTYDDAGGKVVTQSSAGLSTTTSFDRLGRAISVQLSSADISNLGQTQQFFDAAGQLRMTQDALGARQWYIFDDAGRKQAEINALGQLTEYVYNKAGQLTQTVGYANLVDLTTLVDASGKPLDVSVAALRPASSAADLKSWHAYDSLGRLAKTVSPTGAVTEFTYDASSRLLLTRRYANPISTAGLGKAPSPGDILPTSSSSDQILRTFYDKDGLVLGALDGSGVLSENSYDAAGRLVAKSLHAQVLSGAQLNLALAAGTALADIRPGVSSDDQGVVNFFDARGLLVGQLDAEGFFSETHYDASGNVDKTLRYRVRTAGLGASTSLDSVRSAAGGVQTKTVYAYDAINRIVQTRVDPDGSNLTTTTAYDDASKQLFVTDAAGTLTVTQLDAKGRSVAVTVDPSGLRLTTRFTYNAQDQLISSVAADGVLTAYAYDALGRKTTQTVDPAGLNLSTRYSYDLQGRIARVVDPAGQATRYVYDKDGRLQYEVDPADGLTEHRYDALGNRVQSIRYADKQTGVQTVDAGNGLITTTVSAVSVNAAGDQLTQFTYDALGRKSSQTVDPSGLKLTTRYSYDVNGHLARVTDPSGRQTRYAYDALGRLRFELDAANGLTEYRYDAAGNRVQTLQYADPQTGMVTTDIGNGLIQNRQGTPSANPQKDRITTDTFDAAGRRILSRDAANVLTSYEYDGMGRVTSRRVNAAGAAPGAPDRLLYDRAGRLRYEVDAQGKTVEHLYDAAGRRIETIEYATPQDLSALDVAPGTVVMNGAGTPASNWFIYNDVGDGSTIQRVTDAATGRPAIALSGRAGFQLGTGAAPEWTSQGSVISWDMKFSSHFGICIKVNTTQGVRYISYEPGTGAPTLYRASRDETYAIYKLGNDATDGQWHSYTRDFRADLAALDPEAEILSVQSFLIGSNGGPGGEGLIGDVKLSTTSQELLRSNAAYTQFANRGLKASAADRRARHVYDAVGRLRFDVDAAGYATEYRYNDAGQLTETLKHTKPLDAVNFSRGTQPADWSIYEATSSGATVTSVFDEDRKQTVTRLAGNGTRSFFAIFGPKGSWQAQGTQLSWDMKFSEDFYVTVCLETDQGLRYLQYTPQDAKPSDSSPFGLGKQAVDGQWHRYTRDLQADLARAFPGAKFQAVKLFEIRGSGRVTDISLRSTVNEIAAETAENLRIDFSNSEAQKQFHYNKAGEWSPDGGMLLKSFPEAGGSWAAMDKYDWYKPGTPIRVGIKPRDLQGSLHVMIHGGNEGSPYVYQRLGIVMLADGRAIVQVANAKGEWRSVDLGNYQPGTTYTIEFEAGAKGGTVYMHAEGSPRESGWSYTVKDEYSWAGFGIGFAVARDPNQTFSSTAELHYVEIGTSPAPVETRQVNDKLGRPIYTIDATGAVTQIEYDSASRVVARRRYANAIGLADLAQGQALTAAQVVARLRPQAALDQVEYFAYDAAGRMRFAVNGQGEVSEYRYDAAGGLAHTLRYEKPLVLGAQAPSLSTLEQAVPGLGEPRVSSQVLDEAGRVRYSVDPLGIVTENRYDSLGQLSERKVWDTALSTTGAQRASKVLLASDLASALKPSAADRVTRYVFGANGTLRYEQDPLGAVTERRYDVRGRVIEVIRYAKPLPTGLALTEQSFQGTLVSTPAQDLRTRSVYDAAGRLRYTIDAQGNVQEMRYDGLGRMVHAIDWDVRIDPSRLDDGSSDAAVAALLPASAGQASETVYGYDALDRQLFSLDAEGGLVEQVFDALGRVVQRIAYAKPATDAGKLSAVRQQPSVAALRGLVQASPELDRVERRSYDSVGHLLRQVDAEGGVTAFAYDTFGHLTEQVQRARALSAEQLAALPMAPSSADIDLLAGAGDADRRTSYRYDQTGRLRFTIDAQGGVTEQRYLGQETRTVRYKKPLADRSALPEATPGEDRVSSVFADLAGRPEREVDAAGVVTRYQYNSLGQLTLERRAEGRAESSTTSYAYDAAGRMTAKTVGAGTAAASTQGYEYNALGQLVRETEARGMALANEDSAWAQAERQARGLPAGAAELTAAQKAALLSQYSAVHAYDKAGRRTSTVNAAGAVTSTRYNAFGRASAVVDPLGNTGYFYYDKLGRVTLQVDPEGYATRMSYVAADGQVSSVRRYATKVSAVEGTPPLTSEQARDAVQTNSYDRLGRLTQSSDNAGTERTQYGADGNRFNKRVFNKLNAQADFVYDKLGQVIDEAVQVAEGKPQVHSTYTYDTFGNRLSSTEAAGTALARTTTYRYDVLGRLTHRIGVAYTAYTPEGSSRTVTPVDFTRYDALGRVIETISHGEIAGDAVTGLARELSYYDAAGNRTALLKADGGLTTYAYDPAGHLTLESAWAGKVSLPANTGGSAPFASATPGTDRITRYSYDEVGRQVKAERAGVQYWEPAWNAAGTDLVQNLVTVSWLTMQTSAYDAAGRLVQQTDARGNASYFYYDAIGRRTLTIDQESYAVAWDYDSFQAVATTETRYAVRVASYARQDNAAAAASLRNPAILRAGLSLTDARITQFQLDAAGRVTQRELLNVESVYTDADGTQRHRTDSAITRFSYDALGHVTEMMQRGSVSASGADVWLQTSMRYDQLGRLVKRIDAAYKDETGSLVRPVTDTSYDELGQVTSVSRRGSNDASEADDRITRYGYDANGAQTSVTDPSGRITRYAIDAAGHVAFSTVVNGQKTTSGWADIVKRYSYDAAGRVIAEQDQGTGEIRRTRYNAFGDVSAKGLGDGWQEFIEYNALGKIQRNNTDTGGTRIYVYDRNGNATREIQSNLGVDLQTLSVADAAARMDMDNRYSAYDKRNQLLRTADINKSEYVIDKPEAIQKVFTQKLTELYGAVGLANTTGGTAQSEKTDATVGTGTIGANGAGGIARGLDGFTLGVTKPIPTELAVTRNNIPLIGDMAVTRIKVPIASPKDETWDRYIKLGRRTWTYGFNLPDPGVGAHYEVRTGAGYQVGGDYFTASAVNLSGIPTNLNIGVPEVTKFVIRYVDPAAGAVDIGTIFVTNTCIAEDEGAGDWYAGTYNTQVAFVPENVLRFGGLNAGEYIDFRVGIYAGRFTAGTVTNAYFMRYSDPSLVSVKRFDASGNLISAGQGSVGIGPGAGSPVLGAMTDLIDGGTRFREGLLGATVYHRVKGSRSDWTGTPSYALVLAPNEEFLINGTAEGDTTVRWYYGTTGDSMLRALPEGVDLSTDKQTLTVAAPVDAALQQFLSHYPSGQVKLSVTLGGKTLVFGSERGVTAANPRVTFNTSEFLSSSWKTNVVQPISVTLLMEANGVTTRLASLSGGEVRLGADPAIGDTAVADVLKKSTSTQYYYPWASISSTLTGPITIGGVTLAAGDARRWSAGGSTTINFAQWVPSSGSQTLDVAYDYDGFKFTGTAIVSASGSVTLSLVEKTKDGDFTLSVPGAVTFDAVTFAPVPSGSNWVPELIGMTSSTPTAYMGSITWRAKATEFPPSGSKSFVVRFQTRDGMGRPTYTGSTTLTLYAGGSISWGTMSYELMPSYLDLSPPAGTARIDVNVAPDGSDVFSPLTASPNATLGAGKFRVDIGTSTLSGGASLRPSTGTAKYRYNFVGRDANGRITTRGTGSFTVDKTGAMVMGVQAVDRQPQPPLVLSGPVGNKDATQLRLMLTKNGSTKFDVTLNGVWNAGQNRMDYTWLEPLGGLTVSAEDQYDFDMRVQNSSGAALVDAVGTPIKYTGVMVFGASADQPVKVLVKVTELKGSALVQRAQSYNAFGEIVEEYDDAVAARAKAMVDYYKSLGLGSFDAPVDGVRSQMRYNTAGQLVTKTDAWTFETLANGFVRRVRPVTQYGYDLLGRLNSVEDANHHVSGQSFAGSGASTHASDTIAADGGHRSLQFNLFGDVARSFDELGHEVQSEYNKLGQLVLTRRLGISRVQNFGAGDGDQAGFAVASTLVDRYDYDALGRISTQDALGQTSYAWYDSQGRVVRTRSNAGAETVYTRQFIAAGAADGILGAGGRNVGGFKLTTQNADGSSTIDKVDYFGLTSWHQDMGGRQYSYSYDLAGRLSAQTSTSGQNITYKYLQDGLLAEVNDNTLKMRSRYAYDNAANRISESYVKLNALGGVDTVYQASSIQYDELNRMARIWDWDYKSHDLRYEYDAVGNRRAAIALYWDPIDHAQLQRDDHWYLYDAADRFILTKGSVVRGNSATDTNGKIYRGDKGVELTYNAAGQRTSALAGAGAGKKEVYSYTADGYLEDVTIDGVLGSRRRLDALGRTLQYIEWKPTGVQRQKQYSYYDADNRMIRQTLSGTENDGTTYFEYYVSKSGASTGTAGAFGALASTRFIAQKSDSTNVTTTYSYEYWDSAQQKQIVKTASNPSAPGWAPGDSSFTYNANGHLVQVVNGGRTISYDNSAQGLVLRRNDGGATKYITNFYYASGRRIGDVSTDPTARDNRISYAETLARDLNVKPEDRYKNIKPVTSADFDQNYEPINANYPGSVGVRYTVCDGDTLSSIAQAVWGDAAMWYLIAESNGLSANDALVAGQVLVIPNKVTNIHNNANTFRPYNPGEAIGNVDPTLPEPPPPPQAEDGCGGMGQFIVIAVTFAVNAALPGAGSILGTMLNAGIAAAAGQAVGVAVGAVDHFDWNAVGQAALTAGVAEGVGQGLESLTGAGGALNGTGFGDWYRAAGNTVGRAMVNSTLSTAAQQIVRGEWNWQAIAANAVGTGAGVMAGEWVAASLSNTALQDLSKYAAQLTATGVSAVTSSQLMGDSWATTRSKMGAAFVSSLGSVVGSALGESLASPGVDWRNAPDESAAESARLDRSGNRYAYWPDQTDAETARLARSGNAYAAWPDQTDAETARLGRYESRARYMEGMERSWAKQDAAASALALQRQHANADAYRVQLAREAFNFGDGMDARDIRLNSFSYQSRLSLELGKANAELQMRARFDAGPKLVAGAGVERLSGAESYLRKMNGGLDPVRAGNFQFQVAQSLPDAAAVTAGPEMLLGRLAPVLSRGMSAAQGMVLGERSVLMSQLNAEMRFGLQADLNASAALEALSRPNLNGSRFEQIVSQVPGRVIGRSSALTPGALGNTPDSVAGTFAGGRYATVELSDDLVLHRAWAPGQSREFGGFWSTEQPAGSLQTRIDAALLPEWGGIRDTAFRSQATDYTTILVPGGTRIYVGEVGSQGRAWVGGGSQVLIEGGPQELWKIGGGKLR